MDGWSKDRTTLTSPLIQSPNFTPFQTPIASPRTPARTNFSIKVTNPSHHKNKTNKTNKTSFISPLKTSKSSKSKKLRPIEVKKNDLNPSQHPNQLPIKLASRTSRLADLLQAVSYGSIKPNISTLRKYTNQRRPYTSSKVSCFYHADMHASNKSTLDPPPSRARPSTSVTTTMTSMSGTVVPLTYQLKSPPAMMRSPSFSESGHNDLSDFAHQFYQKRSPGLPGSPDSLDSLDSSRSLEMIPLNTQHLDSGLPPSSPFRHEDPLFMMQEGGWNDVRPLTRQELSGTREPLVSNILRDARNGLIRPFIVASYDKNDGTRYVEHKNLVEKFKASTDGHNTKVLKRTFSKQLNSLKKKYRPLDRMTDEMLRSTRHQEVVPMHLRDRQRLKVRRSRSNRNGGRYRANVNRSKGRRKEMNGCTSTRTTRRLKQNSIFQESSLIVDNRGLFKKGMNTRGVCTTYMSM